MIKIIGKIGLAIGIGFLLINLLTGGPENAPTDLAKQVEQGALLIDTRTPSEFSGGHVKGAINIPHDQIVQRIGQYETDPSKPIIVYCRSGNRSSLARHDLIEAGYTNVVNAGSIGDLQKQLKK
ncbi:MAG: rhodanese-like domain-containing protein [Pontiella sp.]